MPDFETVMRAMPIGLLMMLGTYLAARRRKSGLRRAKEGLPEVAARLGLELRPASDPTRIGTLRGTLRGYEVFVDPDERPRLVVYLARAPKVAFRSYEHEKRAPPGMERVHIGRPSVDGFFKDRFAAPEVADALVASAPEIESRMHAFTDELRDRLAHLSITSERLECAFEFGRPAHIPAEVVERVLPEAVELARLFDTAAGDGTSDSLG